MLIYLIIVSSLSTIGTVIAIIITLRSKRYLQKKTQDIEISQSLKEISLQTNIGPAAASKEQIEDIAMQLRDIRKTIESGNNQLIKVHEKRIEKLEKSYMKLLTLNFNIQNLISLFEKKEDSSEEAWVKLNKANEIFYDFQLYFLEHRNHFTEPVLPLLEEIRKNTFISVWNYKQVQHLTDLDIDGEYLDICYEKAHSAATIAKTDIIKGLEKLDNEYKRVLGITK